MARKRNGFESHRDAPSEAAIEQGHGTAPPAMQLNLDFDTARNFKDEITDLMQEMDDIRMKIASAYKSFEDSGGDRAMMKLVIKQAKQDKSKTKSQLRAFGQYREWFLGDAEAEDSEE
jgi:uncharacterized protein (UPF0335 family)